MPASDEQNQFNQVILPHLDAAYNLALWLTRQRGDAEDAVQEALIRALKYFPGYRGENARAWFLTIVRNTCYSWLARRRNQETFICFEEALPERPEENSNPEQVLLKSAQRQKVRQALWDLPQEFREAIVLRELGGLDYREMAAVLGIPIGTVMSRLARGRARLQEALGELRTSL